jgi:hypothetical protein
MRDRTWVEIAFLVVAAVGALIAQRVRSKRMGGVEEVLGLERVEKDENTKEPRLRGLFRGKPITVVDLGSAWEFRADVPVALPAGLELVQQRSAVKGQDLQIGIPDFDDRVRLRASDEAAAIALMRDEAVWRRAVRTFGVAGDARVVGGEVIVRVGHDRSPDALRAAAEDAVGLCAALRAAVLRAGPRRDGARAPVESEPEDVGIAFARAKSKMWLLGMGPIFVAIPLLGMAAIFGHDQPRWTFRAMFAAPIALALFGVVNMFRLSRCPACKALIHRYGSALSIQECPRCRIRLE